MADLLTLNETKLYLRLDSDHTIEDALIVSMINAATKATADYLNLETVDSAAAAPIKAATLLMVADLYENRERQQTGSPLYRNQTYERLLNPYRDMGV